MPNRRARANVVVNTCAVTAEAARQARQTIRRCAANGPGQHRRHRLRGADRAGNIAAMREADRVLGNAEKLTPQVWANIGAAAQRNKRVKGDRRRHHGGQETAPHLIDTFARPHPRLRAGAERLRPPLHLLHHSSAAAIPARCRWTRSWRGAAARRARYHEIVLTGVDITTMARTLPARRGWARWSSDPQGRAGA